MTEEKPLYKYNRGKKGSHEDFTHIDQKLPDVVSLRTNDAIHEVDITSLTKIRPGTIDITTEAMREFAGQMYFYEQVRNELSHINNVAEMNLAYIKQAKYLELRRTLEAPAPVAVADSNKPPKAAKGPSEPTLKAMIEVDKAVVAAGTEFLTASYKLQRAWAIVNSLKNKKEMLIEIARNNRAELNAQFLNSNTPQDSSRR